MSLKILHLHKKIMHVRLDGGLVLLHVHDLPDKHSHAPHGNALADDAQHKLDAPPELMQKALLAQEPTQCGSELAPIHGVDHAPLDPCCRLELDALLVFLHSCVLP